MAPCRFYHCANFAFLALVGVTFSHSGRISPLSVLTFPIFTSRCRLTVSPAFAFAPIVPRLTFRLFYRPRSTAIVGFTILPRLVSPAAWIIDQRIGLADYKFYPLSYQSYRSYPTYHAPYIILYYIILYSIILD